MSDSDKVQILLATYIDNNYERGPEYLKQQLDSLLAQTHNNMEILIRDDGSEPNTLNLIDQYEQAHPDKIKVLRDDKGNLGWKENFIHLMECSTAPYVFFCDQDDVWNPTKVETCVKELQETEKKHGTHTPILVHHDARLMDKNGKIHVESMNKHQHGLKENANLNTLFSATTTTGFTISMNRALIKKSLLFTKHTKAHDGHVGLVAQALGKISYLNQPLAHYRIHENNVSITSSALKKNNSELKKAFNLAIHPAQTLSKINRWAKSLKEQYNYTANFLEHYKNDPAFPQKNKELFKAFNSLEPFNPIKRHQTIKRYNLIPNKKIQLIATLMP